MSSDVALALGAALGASLLTTLGTRWIVGVQAERSDKQQQLRLEHDAELARVADMRSLRDAKRERLRGDLVAISLAADTIHGVAQELLVLFAGDTEESRNERLSAALKSATESLQEPMIRLRLEDGTESTMETFRGIRALWYMYADYDLPRAKGSGDYHEATETMKKVTRQASDVIVAAKAQLDSLSRPI